MSGAAGPRKQSTGLGGRAGAPPGPFVPFVLWGARDRSWQAG